MLRVHQSKKGSSRGVSSELSSFNATKIEQTLVEWMVDQDTQIFFLGEAVVEPASVRGFVNGRSEDLLICADCDVLSDRSRF